MLVLIRDQGEGVAENLSCDTMIRLLTHSRHAQNCYTMRLGGYMTNLQNVTKDPELARRDLLHPVAARVAPVSDFEILAAEQDDNLEAFYRAFPEALADEQSALRKRQVVSNCTGPPPDPNEPPPPPADPRQRIEFLTWPAAPAGSNWSYRWKTRTLATPAGSKLHHHWQLLRRDACGGATVTLSFNNGRAIIKDSIRSGTTPSVDLNQWFGKTIIHSMNVTYGIKGFLSYTAVDAAVPSVPLIKYLARGDMGSSSSLKHGIYRTSTPDTQAITAFHGECKLWPPHFGIASCTPGS